MTNVNTTPENTQNEMIIIMMKLIIERILQEKLTLLFIINRIIKSKEVLQNKAML